MVNVSDHNKSKNIDYYGFEHCCVPVYFLIPYLHVSIDVFIIILCRNVNLLNKYVVYEQKENLNKSISLVFISKFKCS